MKRHVCIATALRRAAAAATSVSNGLLKESGLNVTMLRLMFVCNANPEASITDIAKINGLERTTTGRNLRVLEKQGFIVFSHTKDDRERTVSLTEKGEIAFRKASELWNESQALLSQTLGADEDLVLKKLSEIENLV